MILSLRILFCAVCALCATTAPLCTAHAQPMRAADPISIGKTIHFTLDKGEQKDLAATFAPGTYYIQADIKRVDEKPSNIIMHIDLLKTNGSEVQGGILGANEVHTIARVADNFTVSAPYTAAKPLAARLRVKNEDTALEYWLTIVPVSKRAFLPFPTGNGDLKPLGVGTENGKGGALEGNQWAYHTIKLPAGKYNVSLYLKQPDGTVSNLLADLLLLSPLGTEPSPRWLLGVNAVDKETRQEQRLTLLKSQTLIFRITNTNSNPVEYTVGIEKAE